jgi:hypothetical protein
MIVVLIVVRMWFLTSESKLDTLAVTTTGLKATRPNCTQYS